MGHWQKDIPKRAGKYWARTHEGEDAGILTVCVSNLIGGSYCPEYLAKTPIGEIAPGSVWGGWWWSEPLPEIPPFDPHDLANRP